jgi:hypothetical protein
MDSTAVIHRLYKSLFGKGQKESDLCVLFVLYSSTSSNSKILRV